MGEVYRARDTRLNRDIAIKVLLAAVAGDPDRLARFRREAQVLGALNHPNIAAIYGLEDSDGRAALVLELVEGPTLAERSALGPMPVAEALAIARQIADALEAAHDQSIIHRDLKPANIKVKADGTVKVLDFGLAKALDPPLAVSADAMSSPTLSVRGTEAGMILGTAAYMSPEQARGKPVDKRADIWAFGCVLFEMVTGRRAFAGETVSDTIAAVLEREPDWTRLPASTPPAIRRLLRRCLDKERSRRLRDIGDARLEIEDSQRGSAPEAPLLPGGPRRRERLAWMLALAVVTLAAIGAVVWARRPAAPAAEMRVEIATPPTRDPLSLAISPDGRAIVFVAISEGQSRLWLRPLDSASAQPLAGTEAASLPFWSPDSRSVGFFADGKLKRIDLAGGSATVLADAPFGQGGAWHPDGVMLFTPTPATPLLQIPATGGAAVPATTVQAPQQVGHGYPQFLPGGRHFLFHVTGAPGARGVYVGRLGGTETSRLIEAETAASFAASGHLLFLRQGTLFAQEFDLVRLALAGSPVVVAENVAVETPRAAFSASDAGPIIYRVGAPGAQRDYSWFDQTGKEIDSVARADTDFTSASGLSLAPDERRAALFRQVTGNMDIWVIDLERGALTRITLDEADDILPVWSPDSTRLAFSSTRREGGSLDLFLKSATGTGVDDLLLATPQIKAASDWSPDGRFVVYSSPAPETGFDIWAVPVDGDRKPFTLVQTRANERSAQFSPDGQWIAYESNESGRYEIYVQRFVTSGSNPAGKVPVSTTGGAQVRWRRDGKALFYMALDNRMMTVPIRVAPNGQAVELGGAVPLFASRALGGAQQAFPQHQYGVSRDGQRFVMIVERDDTPTAPITLLLNWAGRAQ